MKDYVKKQPRYFLPSDLESTMDQSTATWPEFYVLPSRHMSDRPRTVSPISEEHANSTETPSLVNSIPESAGLRDDLFSDWQQHQSHYRRPASPGSFSVDDDEFYPGPEYEAGTTHEDNGDLSCAEASPRPSKEEALKSRLKLVMGLLYDNYWAYYRERVKKEEELARREQELDQRELNLDYKEELINAVKYEVRWETHLLQQMREKKQVVEQQEEAATQTATQTTTQTEDPWPYAEFHPASQQPYQAPQNQRPAPSQNHHRRRSGNRPRFHHKKGSSSRLPCHPPQLPPSPTAEQREQYTRELQELESAKYNLRANRRRS